MKFAQPTTYLCVGTMARGWKASAAIRQVKVGASIKAIVVLDLNNRMMIKNLLNQQNRKRKINGVGYLHTGRAHIVERVVDDVVEKVVEEKKKENRRSEEEKAKKKKFKKQIIEEKIPDPFFIAQLELSA